MSRHQLGFLVAVALLLNAGLSSLSLACGPWPPDARFWFRFRAGPERKDFLAGDLGVLAPELASIYWFVAYRHLSGAGLDADSQKAVGDYWEPATEAETAEVERRGTHFKPGGWDGWVQSVKSIELPRNGRTSHIYFGNCKADAFATAARTLRDRSEHFGPDSELIAQWKQAQSQVFENCSGSAARIPAALPAEAPPLARADREYQIGAAHFYATDVESAEASFRAIAQNVASPWSRLARYLLARVYIRRALLLEEEPEAWLARAQSHLEGLLDDPEMESLHAASERLLHFVRARTAPIERGRELVDVLGAATLEGPLRQSLIDYFHLMPMLAQWDSDRMSVWIQTARPPSASALETALTEWRQTNGLPWLVLALMKVGPEHPAVEALLGAARRVEPASPAYLTLTHQRARLLAAMDRPDSARALVDAVLDARPGMSRADRNRFYALRETLARDPSEFVRFAQKVPVEVGFADGGRAGLIGYPNDRLSAFRDGRALFEHRTVHVLNRDFTPRHLLELVRDAELTAFLKRQVALAAWTRAVLLRDAATAAELAAMLSGLAPGLRGGLAFHAAAGSSEERAFATSVTMLRLPGLSPLVAPTVGRVAPLGKRDGRNNWWCGYSPGSDGEAIAAPAFLASDPGSATDAMRAPPEEIEAAPLLLGRRVLDWAASHPDDERLAEALHLAVQATRYGCHYGPGGRIDYGDVSRAAFRRCSPEIC